MMESGVPVCNTCGEQVEFDANGEVFVACRQCHFPICRDCLSYELKGGRKVCLRCGTPYDGNSHFQVFVTFSVWRYGFMSSLFICYIFSVDT